MGLLGVRRELLLAQEHWAVLCALLRYHVFVLALCCKCWWGREHLQWLRKGSLGQPSSAPRGRMINDTISVLMFQELMSLENMASVSPGG